jgi:hypothetical protein
VLVTAGGITPDGAGVSVRGVVNNPGEVPVTVTEADVSLTVQGAPVGMLNASPPLPWTIAPGGSLQFALTFQRPAANAAMLNVLGYQFEIQMR